MSPEEREQLLDQPALHPPPTGIVPNFEDPYTFRSWSLPLQITLFIIITGVVAARVYTKLKIAKRVLTEDYVVLLAYAEFVVFMTFSLMMSDRKLGAHMWDITVRTRIRLFKLYYDGVILYFILMVTIRISVILQILHTFVPGGNRNFVWWTGHILLWVNLLSYGAFVIIELNTCKPRAKEWDPTIEGGKCLNLSEVRFVIAILNVFSDLIMMILPQRIIWGLSLPPMRKLKLSILFLFGILAMACGCVQIYLGIDMSLNKLDKSHKISKSQLWAMLEVASGLLVACLPVIPKFVTVVWNTTAGSKVGTTLRSVLRLSSHSSTDKHVPLDEGEEILTIGRQPGPMRKAFRPGVSDIDYENLMAETRDTGGTKTGGELITMTDMSWVSDTRESRKGSGTAQSFPSTYKGER